jgi:mannan endo-1,4-beta-mannosidase
MSGVGAPCFAQRFYEDEEAMRLADAAIAFVVGRTSSLSGEPLRNSPAILAWELCNEPRGDSQHAAYLAWLHRAAALVKRLDPHHLLTIGSEGTTPFADAGVDVLQVRISRDLICHWSALDLPSASPRPPLDLPSTYGRTTRCLRST